MTSRGLLGGLCHIVWRWGMSGWEVSFRQGLEVEVEAQAHVVCMSSMGAETEPVVAGLNMTGLPWSRLWRALVVLLGASRG